MLQKFYTQTVIDMAIAQTLHNESLTLATHVSKLVKEYATVTNKLFVCGLLNDNATLISSYDKMCKAKQVALAKELDVLSDGRICFETVYEKTELYGREAYKLRIGVGEHTFIVRIS